MYKWIMNTVFLMWTVVRMLCGKSLEIGQTCLTKERKRKLKETLCFFLRLQPSE